MQKRSGNNQSASGDENMRVVEERIHPEVFLDFHRYLEMSVKEINPGIIKDIKRELAGLAKAGTIEAYRTIENIIENPTLSDVEHDFAVVALNFCRFSIENDLLDIPTDMISGGLGGMNNKIRYYVALTGKESLTENNYKDIESVFKEVLSESDSVLEQVSLHDFYVSFLILGSLDYAIGNILDKAIHRCGFLEKIII
ncbi:MAG: hypothetical protein IPJ37_10940 [Bacteroidales bacterium]|nr:hypothetical protein [Bacteroidales bacterium]